jgi:deazaflavin-dependent oxidoreductase (nitroreductase family)
MNSPVPTFREPTAVEKIFNRVFGFLVGLGLGFAHNYLLEVRGRKSGKLFSTPVDLLELDGKRYLVAPRGRTQWVRNAEAAEEITLKKGSKRLKFRLRAISDTDKPQILKAYLDNFKREVQTYFPIPAGSPVESFAAIAGSYPAFELLPLDLLV